MITLRELHQNTEIFQKYPELNNVWEIPALQKDAQDSYEEWMPFGPEGTSMGNIFSINEDDMPIGVIGWMEQNEDAPTDTILLRYYGIVPSRRGNGYGAQAMRLFLEYLSRNKELTEHLFLQENVSIGRTVAPKIIAHFKRMGFEEFGELCCVRNARCGKVQRLRIRIHQS